MLQILGPESGGSGGMSSSVSWVEMRGSCFTQEVWLEEGEGEREEEAGSSFRFRARGAGYGSGEEQVDGVDVGWVCSSSG